jgi:type I restriction enzyme R subunit
MHPQVLYEPPFTDMHYEGLDGVLLDHADTIVSILRGINKNARVA